MPPVLVLLMLALLLPAALSAQHPLPAPATPSPTAILLGTRLGPVPDLLYSHLPTLPQGRGVLVEDIVDEQAANRLRLRRHDIVLTHDGQPVRDANHLARLWQTTSKSPTVQLGVVRAGRLLTLAVPADVFAPLVNIPKGTLKPGHQPTLNVEAQPLGAGKLQVTLTYYCTNGKLKTVNCSGSLAEIETEVKQLSAQNRFPPPVQELVDVAVKRLKTLNAP